MMGADSLRVAVHLVVPSGVSFCWPSPCRRACSAGANPTHWAPHFALPSAQPSNVQASCLERAWLAAFIALVRAFAGALAAHAAAPPGRRCPERQRGTKAEGEGQRRKARQKDAAPGRVESQSAHGSCAARSGFAAVPRGAQGPRQCRHVRVLRTPGHAGACRERSHD